MKTIDVSAEAEIVNAYIDVDDLARNWILGIVEKLKMCWHSLIFSASNSQPKNAVVTVLFF